QGAIFDNAELANTTFVGADLRQASFRSLDESAASLAAGDRVPFGRTQYIDHLAGALDVNAQVAFRMPNFSCANLEGAIFDGHALFPGVIEWRRSYSKADQTKSGWYQTVPSYVKEDAQTKDKVDFAPLVVQPPKFSKASLKNAHLDKSQFFTFGQPSEFSQFSTSSSGINVGDVGVSQGMMTEDAFKDAPQRSANAAQHTETQEERQTRAAVNTF